MGYEFWKKILSIVFYSRVPQIQLFLHEKYIYCIPTLYPHVPGNKLTQKDNSDNGVQFITSVDPRQSLLLAKDSNRFL